MSRFLPLSLITSSTTRPIHSALRQALDPHKPIDHSLRCTIANLTSLSSENSRITSNILIKHLDRSSNGGRRVRLVLGVADVVVEKGGQVFREIWAREGLPKVVKIAKGGSIVGTGDKSGGEKSEKVKVKRFRWSFNGEGIMKKGKGKNGGEKETMWTAQRLIKEWAEGYGSTAESIDGGDDVGKLYWRAYQGLMEDGLDFDRAMREITRPANVNDVTTSDGIENRSISVSATGFDHCTSGRGSGSGGNRMSATGGVFTFLEVLHDCRGLIDLFAREVDKLDVKCDKGAEENDMLNSLCRLVQTATTRIQYVAEHSNNDEVITKAVELQSKAQDTLANYRQIVDTRITMRKSAEQVIEIAG